MKIIVSGASGDLGGKVTRRLLKQVPVSDLILTTRNPGALSEITAKGAQVRWADFGHPEGLVDAFIGGNMMLLISTLSIGHRRIEHHRNALQAAQKAGVSHVIYTSNEMISYEMAIKQGFFAICSRHVEFITGRAATTLRQVIESNRQMIV